MMTEETMEKCLMELTKVVNKHDTQTASVTMAILAVDLIIRAAPDPAVAYRDTINLMEKYYAEHTGLLDEEDV